MIFIFQSTGESHLKKRWEMIEEALSKPLRNSHELADAILSYNTKFRNIWKFRGLHKLFNEVQTILCYFCKHLIDRLIDIYRYSTIMSYDNVWRNVIKYLIPFDQCLKRPYRVCYQDSWLKYDTFISAFGGRRVAIFLRCNFARDR